MSEEKRAYLDMINRAAQECNDISMLDLVWKLLARAGGGDAE